MTEYSKQLTQPKLWFWGLSFFYGSICLAITCSWTKAQEMPHESYESFAIPQPTGSPDGLPRVRSLGKLVSIEGAVGDPGMVREIEGTNTESEFLTEFPLGFDPESQANQFKLPNLIYFSQEPYANYRTNANWFEYIPGDGDQFGWLSLGSDPYQKRGYRSGFSTAINIHLLSGPNAVALPPRLFDFSLGYQTRGRIQDVMSYDLATTIGIFADFEGSARNGVRFPGHAVGMLHYTPEIDVVFGVDYLSRDDIKLLPVMGLSWRPKSMESMRFDLVFPRPRIDYTLDQSRKLYVAGRLGGGTWEIEFPNSDNDVMTYRDLQLVVGLERLKANGNVSAWEFGYLFDRNVEFRTLTGETHFDDAFLFRIVMRK